MVAITKRVARKSLDAETAVPITEKEYADRAPFRIVGRVMMALAAAMVVCGVVPALIDYAL